MHKDGKFILEVSKRVPKPGKYSPNGVLAIDINEKEIVIGNRKCEYRFETAIERALHYKQLAENLQKRHSSPKYNAWLRRRGILVKHGRGLYKLTKDYDESVLATADDAASKVKENLSSVRVVSEGGMPVVRFHAIGDFMNYLKSLAFFHYFSDLMLKQSVGYGRVYLGLSKRCIEWELQRAKALVSEAAEGRWVVGCHGFYGRRGFKRYSALMPLHFCAGRHAYEVGLDVYIDEELARELVAFVGRKPFLKMYLGSVKE